MQGRSAVPRIANVRTALPVANSSTTEAAAIRLLFRELRSNHREEVVGRRGSNPRLLP